MLSISSETHLRHSRSNVALFGKGFHLKFENNWTVSVQFGEYNYCTRTDVGPTVSTVGHQSNDAEIAAWDKNGNWYKFSNGEQVKGWQSADEIADFIQFIKNCKGNADDVSSEKW